MSRFNKFLILGAVFSTLLLAALIVFRASWLPIFGHLIVEDKLNHPKYDALVLLMGKPIERTRRAVTLWALGKANYIIFARSEDYWLKQEGCLTNDGDITKTQLQLAGVPPDSIVYLNQTRNRSTRDEAVSIFNYLNQKNFNWTRLLLVSSWSHTSRAAWIFRRFSGSTFKIDVTAAYPDEGGPDEWWTRESSFLSVFNEYLKWVYYVWNY